MSSSASDPFYSPPVLSFIGWHNSGKTTLICKVLTHMKRKGYTVGVIKSTKERDILIDQPSTDTARYRATGIDGIALLAPDQLIVQLRPPDMELRSLARWLFPEVDVVLAEGFKHSTDVPKIEVRRDPHSPLLYEQVTGVVAVATDLPLSERLRFRLDQSFEIAEFIELHLGLKGGAELIK
ncbi:MAG: molybdopterin-guanine dinucleotide biosynthesis protein B [Desulfobulbus sp.]|nr:molybdopterin-guanine dinucleotide biosynthesis protein B [Desulfobulbus sp.]